MNKDNMRLIATVMGEDSTNNRNNEVSALLDYGYSQYKMKTVISKNKVLKRIKNDKIKEKEIEIVPLDNVSILTKTGEDIHPKYKIKVGSIKTNIKHGEKVGTIEIKDKGKVINKMDLTVKNDIQKANILELYLKYLEDTISGNVNL